MPLIAICSPAHLGPSGSSAASCPVPGHHQGSAPAPPASPSTVCAQRHTPSLPFSPCPCHPLHQPHITSATPRRPPPSPAPPVWCRQPTERLERCRRTARLPSRTAPAAAGLAPRRTPGSLQATGTETSAAGGSPGERRRPGNPPPGQAPPPSPGFQNFTGPTGAAILRREAGTHRPLPQRGGAERGCCPVGTAVGAGTEPVEQQSEGSQPPKRPSVVN